jgi:hypothetical protein
MERTEQIILRRRDKEILKIYRERHKQRQSIGASTSRRSAAAAVGADSYKWRTDGNERLRL